MADWTDTSILIAALAAGKAVTDEKLQALAENPVASAEASATAIVNETVWHPYNKVTVGDTNDGLIYDAAVSGAVASVVSPDFEDGYEYRFRWDLISFSSGGTTLRIELYRETSAAYDAVTVISPNVTLAGDDCSGQVEVIRPRLVLKWCPVEAVSTVTSSSGVITATSTSFFSVNNTAQKRLRARFTPSTGNIDGGKIYMDRRRVIV